MAKLLSKQSNLTTAWYLENCGLNIRSWRPQCFVKHTKTVFEHFPRNIAQRQLCHPATQSQSRDCIWRPSRRRHLCSAATIDDFLHSKNNVRTQKAQSAAKDQKQLLRKLLKSASRFFLRPLWHQKNSKDLKEGPNLGFMVLKMLAINSINSRRNLRNLGVVLTCQSDAALPHCFWRSWLSCDLSLNPKSSTFFRKNIQNIQNFKTGKNLKFGRLSIALGIIHVCPYKFCAKE